MSSLKVEIIFFYQPIQPAGLRELLIKRVAFVVIQVPTAGRWLPADHLGAVGCLGPQLSFHV